MNEPRIAVVIPCYNDGAFITEAVASVGEQEPCELVIVDDGSTDSESLRVLADLERSGVRVVRQENRGFCAARMTGVAATSARYVHPLDADDRFPPGVLTALADALDADLEAQAAWGDIRTFGALDCYSPQARQLDPWRITYFDEIPGTSLLRRRALLDTGGWDMGSGFADWDLWMKGAERGWRGVHLPVVTLLYRQHPVPRMYAESLHHADQLKELLRSRHPGLFRDRPRNWLRSRSPWPIKVLWPAIDSMPLRAARKHQLYALARHLFERQMSSDCFRGPVTRARELVGRARGGVAGGDPNP